MRVWADVTSAAVGNPRMAVEEEPARELR